MNAHTKQQQDKVFETDFIDSQKLDPPICSPFGTKSYTSATWYEAGLENEASFTAWPNKGCMLKKSGMFCNFVVYF